METTLEQGAPETRANHLPNHFQGLSSKGISADARDMHKMLADLGLLETIASLEITGLAIVPPEKVAGEDLLHRVRQAFIGVCERRSGVRPDIDGGATHGPSDNPFGQVVSYLLFEDPALQDLLLNPTVLALASYAVGHNACISAFQGLVKAPGGPPLNLHADELMVPAPFSANPGSINITYILTDYSVENGCTTYVPGSHRYYRQPFDGEALDQQVPVEAPAGSILIWTANTWHGSLPRVSPGLRMALTLFFQRPHMRTQENYRDFVSEELLAKHPPRFRTLMGKNLSYGWTEQGPVLNGSETLIGTNVYR